MHICTFWDWVLKPQIRKSDDELLPLWLICIFLFKVLLQMNTVSSTLRMLFHVTYVLL